MSGESLIQVALELLQTTRAQIESGRLYRMDAQEVLEKTMEAMKRSKASIDETDSTMQRWWYRADLTRD